MIAKKLGYTYSSFLTNPSTGLQSVSNLQSEMTSVKRHHYHILKETSGDMNVLDICNFCAMCSGKKGSLAPGGRL